jgi:hypothetical protein
MCKTLTAAILAAVTMACAGGTAAQDRLSLEAVLSAGPARDVQPIFGLVHAASKSAPSEDLIKSLDPLYWRTGSLTAELAPRMRSVGAMPVHVLSDVWGYPRDGRLAPFADLAAFSAQVRSQAQRLGPDAIYDVWNEANSGDYWFGWFGGDAGRMGEAEARFYDTFEAAYRAVESVHGQRAKVAGPSLSTYDIKALRRFMDAMLARGVRVDTLAWHDFPTTIEGIAAIESHLKEARREFIDNPRYAAVGVRQLLIGESMSYETQFSPGFLIAHLYHAEAGGAAGLLRACWNEPAQGRGRAISNCWNNSLDGLLTADGAPRAGYWATAAYAATGQGRIGARQLGPGLYGFASRPKPGHAVLLAASARTTAVTLDIPRRTGPIRMARIPMSGDGRTAMARPRFEPVVAGAVKLSPQEVVIFDIPDR